MSEDVTFNKEDHLADMPEELQNVPVGPMIGISAIALNLALKYHDIATVQDGALYQQYKLEGRNMRALHFDYVLDTAMQIEKHLVDANRRVAKLMVLAALEDETGGGEGGAEPATDDAAAAQEESGEGRSP